MHPLCHDILHLIHCQIEKGPFDFFCFSQNTRYPIFIYTLKLTKKQEKQEKSLHKKRGNQDFCGKAAKLWNNMYFYSILSSIFLLPPSSFSRDKRPGRSQIPLILPFTFGEIWGKGDV